VDLRNAEQVNEVNWPEGINMAKPQQALCHLFDEWISNIDNLKKAREAAGCHA